MTDTAKLGVTKIEVSQSQKEVTANAAFDKFDKAIAGLEDIEIAGGAGNQTLSADDQLNSAIVLSGTITGDRDVIVSLGKKWHFYNDCDGAYTVTVKTAAGTGVEIPAGEWREVLNDGTNVVEIGGGGGGGGGGVEDFLDLGQVPASFSGQALRLLRVNVGETAIEFVDPSVQAAIMSQTVGDGSEDTFAIPHGFGSLDVLVIVRESTDSGADGYIRIDTGYEVRFYDEDTVQVIFDSPPSAGQYVVTCALPWIQADVPVASPGSSTYATPGEYEFVVPPGVTEVTGKMWGAGGGGSIRGPSGISKSGGGGGFAEGTLSVTAGEVLTVHVGGGGSYFAYASNTTGGAGGGGLTAILRGSTPLLVAGGGGGAGIAHSTNGSNSGNGGAGGGSSGEDGGDAGASWGGAGGTQVGGGAGAASSIGPNGGTGNLMAGGTAGYAVDNTNDAYGGAGGAGYYGGGGGGADSASNNWSFAGGGGGGSGYVSGSSTTNTAGSGLTPANTGDGEYVTGVGVGGSGSVDGGPGWVKLSWS